jgi:hypothetical protein
MGGDPLLHVSDDARPRDIGRVTRNQVPAIRQSVWEVFPKSLIEISKRTGCLPGDPTLVNCSA